MTGAVPHQAIALLCDEAGSVQEVLRDDYGLLDSSVEDSPNLQSLVVEEHRDKCAVFLEEVLRSSAAFNVELRLAGAGHGMAFLFHGGLLQGKILVVAGATQESLNLFFHEELLRINNEQTNQLRQLMKQERMRGEGKPAGLDGQRVSPDSSSASRLERSEQQAGFGWVTLDLSTNKVSLSPGAVLLLDLSGLSLPQWRDDFLSLYAPSSQGMFEQAIRESSELAAPITAGPLERRHGQAPPQQAWVYPTKDEADSVALLEMLLIPQTGAGEDASEMPWLVSDVREAFEALADGILLVDSEGLVRFANHSARSMLGRGKETLLGFPFGFPISPGNLTEIDILRKDGSPTPAFMRTTRITIRRRAYYLISLRDNSYQRKLERNLSELERAQANLLAGLKQAVLVLSRDGRINQANPAACELLHDKPGTLEGSAFSLLLDSSSVDDFKRFLQRLADKPAMLKDVMLHTREAGLLEVNLHCSRFLKSEEQNLLCIVETRRA